MSFGACTVDTLSDGWTVTTRDRCLAAHYEHTMVITRGRPLLLTALPGTSP